MHVAAPPPVPYAAYGPSPWPAPRPLPDRLTGGRRVLLDATLLVLLVAGAVGFVLSFLPGHEVYQGGTLIETREAGHPLIACWSLAAAAGALWLRRRPDRRRTRAIAGALTFTLVTVILYVIATFDLSFDIEWGRRHVELWPVDALERTMPFVIFAGPVLLVLQAILFRLERQRLAASVLPRAIAHLG